LFDEKTDIKTTFKDVAGLEEKRRNTRNCWILKILKNTPI
jgi:hypothetical protein